MTRMVEALPAASQAPAVYLGRVFRGQWRRYRKAWKRCRGRYSEQAVHQLRVDTRRMLALLAVLHTLWWEDRLASIQRHLKRLFRKLSRLRDTQVQLLLVEDALDAFPGLAAFDRALVKRERRLVARVGRQVERFEMKKVRKLVTAVERTLDTRRDQAIGLDRDWRLLRQSIDQAFARVTRLRAHVTPREAATIHRVRVAFKRFRYLIELLQPLLPEVSTAQLAAMHDYQTHMGEIQDLEVLQAAWEEFGSRKELPPASFNPFRSHLKSRRATLVTAYLNGPDPLPEFWLPPPRQTRPAPRSRRTLG